MQSTGIQRYRQRDTSVSVCGECLIHCLICRDAAIGGGLLSLRPHANEASMCSRLQRQPCMHGMVEVGRDRLLGYYNVENNIGHTTLDVQVPLDTEYSKGSKEREKVYNIRLQNHVNYEVN